MNYTVGRSCISLESLRYEVTFFKPVSTHKVLLHAVPHYMHDRAQPKYDLQKIPSLVDFVSRDAEDQIKHP